MVNQRPEALRLADALDVFGTSDYDQVKAAIELRRLHDENQKLRKALEQQMEGHDKTLDELRIAEQDMRELLAALKACDEAMSYMSEYDIPLTLPDQVKAAIAKATGGKA